MVRRTQNNKNKKTRNNNKKTRKQRHHLSYHKKPNYTKKRGQVTRRRRRNTRKQDGGVVVPQLIFTIVIPFLIDEVKDYLEDKCADIARKHRLTDSKGRQVERCGLSELKNSKTVIKWVISYYKEKIIRYKKVIVPIFLNNLNKEGLAPSLVSLTKLRSSNDRQKLKTAIKLTLEDPLIKEERERDIGYFIFNIVKNNSDHYDLKKKTSDGIRKKISDGSKKISGLGRKLSPLFKSSNNSLKQLKKAELVVD